MSQVQYFIRTTIVKITPCYMDILEQQNFSEVEPGQEKAMAPTPVLLPGKSHGRRSLVGCSPWVTTGRTRLSDFTFTFHFHTLEKEMATHSSVLAWRIPGAGSLVGCHLWVHIESDTTEVTQQQQQNLVKQEEPDSSPFRWKVHVTLEHFFIM